MEKKGEKTMEIKNIAKIIMKVAKKLHYDNYGILPNLQGMQGSLKLNIKAWKNKYRHFLTEKEYKNLPNFLTEKENLELTKEFINLVREIA